MEGNPNPRKTFFNRVLESRTNRTVNLREASRISGYSQDYLGQLIRGGKIQGTRSGRAWVINLRDLDAYRKLDDQKDAVKEDLGHTAPGKNLRPRFAFFKPQVTVPYTTMLRAGGAVLAAFVFIFAGAHIADGKAGAEKLVSRITSEIPSKIAEISDIANNTLRSADGFIYSRSYAFSRSAKIAYLSYDSSVENVLYASHREMFLVVADFNHMRRFVAARSRNVLTGAYQASHDQFTHSRIAVVRSLHAASDSLYDFSYSSGSAVKEAYVFASNYLYNSSFASAQTVKYSYLAANDGTNRLLSDTFSNISDTIGAAYAKPGLSELSTASILDPLTSSYRTINEKIANFFGDTYLKVVETIIPGYSREGPVREAFPSQLARDLEQTKQELQELKEKGVGRVVQRVASAPARKEIARISVHGDDPQLLVIEGDVSKLQKGLAFLQNTISSSNLSFTNSRLGALEDFIINQNRTVAVSSTNTTQIRYILDNISAISLELNTNSDRVGLFVNQRGTSHIIQFQDKGTDILTIADGGATTLNTQSSLFNLDTGALDIDSSGNITLDTSGTTTMAFTTANGNITLDTSTGNNQIQLASGSGEIDLTTTGIFDLNSATTTIDASSGFSIDGNYASNLSVTGANLTLSTITSGNILLTSAGTITVTGNTTFNNDVTTLGTQIFGGAVTATSTLSINNTSGGDPLLQFQDNGTTRWTVGFDNSDNDKFRITTLDGAFNATSSGLTINAAGFVGIGTTNPGQALSIDGNLEFVGAQTISTTANNNLTITAGGTGDLLLTADNDTFVGIGDTSPDFLLDIASASAASTTLSIDNTSTGDAQILFRNNGVDEWFIGYDDSDADKFRIAPGAFNATSSGLTINAAGFVGIGTTNPSQALTIGTGSVDLNNQGSLLNIGVAGNDWTSTNLTLADSVNLVLGTGSDLTIVHDGSNSIFTSITGDLIFDNTNVNGTTTIRLGSDTASSAFEIRGNDDVFNFRIDGAGAASFAGDLTISGGDIIGINSTSLDLGEQTSGEITITGDLVPSGSSDTIGSTGNRWEDAFFVNLDVTNLTAASSSSSGTTAATFTINSDQSDADAVDMSLAFERGSVTPNAVIQWDSAADSFDFNFPLRIQATTTPQLTIGEGSASDTALLYDGNEQDFYIALQDSSNNLLIGTGSTIGSNVLMVIENGGNIGIGDTSPDFLLDIASSSSASTTLSIDNTSTGDAQLLFRNNGVDEWFIGYDDSQADVFRITDTAFSATNATGLTIEAGGNVGIGTTNPGQALSIDGNLEFVGAQTISTTVGNLTLSAAAGNDVLIGDDSTFLFIDGGLNTIGFFSAATGTADIRFLFAARTASGTSAHRMNLDDAGSAYTIPTGGVLATMLNLNRPELTLTDTLTTAATLRIANAPNEATNNYALFVDDGVSRFDGNVGIGIIDPWADLQVGSSSAASTTLVIENTVSSPDGDTVLQFQQATSTWFIGVDKSSDELVFATSSIADGHIRINYATGEMLFGSGTSITHSKIDVGAVDPVYNIDGIKYATFMAAMIGMKEESTGIVTLQATSDPSIFTYTLDFSAAQEGSDLWLYKNIIDWGTNMEDLIVLLTPQGRAEVSYKKDAENNRVILYGNSAVEVSYRLSAPRYDHAIWSNLTTSSIHGLVVSNTSLSGGAPIDLSQLSLDMDITFGTSLNFLNSSTTTEFAFTLDSSSTPILKLVDNAGLSLLEITNTGNIGIGTSASTTRPITIKQGMGSAIADGWDVYSLQDYKTNIEYLGEEDTRDILEKIKATPVARYNYKTDDDFADKRLGIIVEQAPLEIISKTKQGISLYDLATFTLAGVKELANKQDELEQRVLALEFKLDGTGSLAIDTTTDVEGGTTPATTDPTGFLAALKDAFNTLGATIGDNILKVTQLVTGKLTVEQSSGETIENTIGEGVILKGATSTVINAPSLGEFDKVFVSSEKPIALGVADKSAGEGFRVALAEPAEEDIYFDWWIVGVQLTNNGSDNNIDAATTTNAGSPSSAEATEDDQGTSVVDGPVDITGQTDTQNTTTTNSGTNATTSDPNVDPNDDGSADSLQGSANASSTVVGDTSTIINATTTISSATTTINNTTSTPQS